MSSAPTQLSGDSTSKSKQEIGSTNKCEDEQVSSGASSENVGESTQEQADTTSSENMNPSKPPPEDVKTSDVLDEIIYLIPKAKTQLTDEWVYIIDSGGQPAFQELCYHCLLEQLLSMLSLLTSLNILMKNTLTNVKPVESCSALIRNQHIQIKNVSNPQF